MKNLQSELKQWLDSNPKWNQTRVSKKLDISNGALSSWLGGTYKGDSERIGKAVQQFLKGQIFEAQESVKKDFDFCETSIYKKIEENATLAEHCGEIRVATGLSGIGKTTALKHIKAERSGMILIEAYQGMTKQTIFRNICKQIGEDTRGNFDTLFNRAVDRLKGSERLIAVDEAEHLSFKTIDAIRRIHDFAGNGVLLVGHPRFFNELKHNQGEYAYLYNRLSMPVDLKQLKDEDVAQLVSTVIDSPVDTTTWSEVCAGIGRDLKHIVLDSMRAAKISNVAYNDGTFINIIKEVTKRLGRAPQYA